MKTLFTSNHVEVDTDIDTDIVCCYRSFNISCVVKDISQRHQYIYFDDLFICSSTTRAPLAYANRQDSFASIRKIYEIFGSTTCLLLPQFHTITGCDTVSSFI